MLAPFEKGMKIIGELEGFEYIVNAKSLDLFTKAFLNYNQMIAPSNDFTPYAIPESITQLHVNPNQFLLVSNQSQFVINKNATKHALPDIDALNKA